MVSASFLCVFNVAFMIAGIFLNSVVIISLRRSSQLRKKLCHFVLNIERVLALIYSFVHHTSVTKRRPIFLLVTMMILFVIVLSLPYFNNKISLVLLSVLCIPMFWLVLFYLNYKMFILTRSK